MIPLAIGLYYAFKWATSELLEDEPTHAEVLDRLLAVDPWDMYK